MTDEPLDVDKDFDKWIHDLGAPVTSEQATAAVLSMIHTDLAPTIPSEHPAATLERLDKVHGSLSRGEQYLVAIARTIWNPLGSNGAPISMLGGLDRTNRRRVLMILVTYYLGADMPRPGSPSRG